MFFSKHGILLFSCRCVNKVCLSPNPPLVQVGEHRYQVETAYFSPDGALLRYNRGKVVFLVNTKVGCVG